MKLAIFSDTHDNLATLKQALDWLAKEKIEEIIHCGDLANPDTLDFLIKNFSGPINLARGNADNPELASRSRVKLWGEYGEVVVEGKKLAFTHFPEKALELAKNSRSDFVFYGHTHKPWEEKIGSTRLVNPGNLAGIVYRATFATYDTASDKLELKILEKLNPTI
jgi:hypothetical protein